MTPRARNGAAALIVVLAAGVVYRSAVGAYFFDDDFQWLVDTWTFGPGRLFGAPDPNHFYRPVIDLYLAAAVSLFNGSPVLFHVANIILHALNGLLLLALVRAISGSDLYAFVSALLFVVQPSDVDTIAWISALAEAVSACFGCLALLSFLHFRRDGSSRWYTLSIAAFVLALMTHESSVVFFPLMLLGDWTVDGETRTGSPRERRWQSRLRAYVPHAIALCIYLAVDLRINSRHYLVTEGHYTLGFHVLTNARDYLVAMYVGKGNAVNYLFITALLAGVLMTRTRRVMFGAAWLALSLAPFVLFTWGTSFRYLYLPSMGFSMLLAEVVVRFDRWLASRTTDMVRVCAVGLLVITVAVRFAIFASANVKRFAERTESYRRYITAFTQLHERLPNNSRIVIDVSGRSLPPGFLTALVQWTYHDSTIELVADGPESPSR